MMKKKCVMEPLKTGEIICPTCNGSCYENDSSISWYNVCDICLGAGKLDWIEAAVGKKKFDKITLNTLYGNFGQSILKNPGLLIKVEA